MKKYITYLAIMTLAASLISCDDNEIMPGYAKKGTATSTVATIDVSNTEPDPAEDLTITVTFVNPSFDPLTQVTLKAKVDDAAYVDVQTFNTQSDQMDKEITQTVNYVAPASGTVILFDLVISSKKEFPMIRRATVEVQ
jgi:hypothetical protein